VIIAVITATPTCIIPAKETYFSLIKSKMITNLHNRLITVALVSITFILSVALPNIKAAIALTGATINPLIGFIFPILFYLKLEKNLSIKSPQKLFALFILMFVVITSILALQVYYKAAYL
jgi:amino acid permease